ncbi:MAG TPA: succinate dehydrogenase, cytochrome b556 subunit [Gammaproteobacteria bacterium]|nr:succinate dehydrogenase, cytochrome b556 subunit [Gammaproteobacteria bacterium]
MATIHRPLSPHLQVYRPQLTAILSITHRATGLFLVLGSLLLVYWLHALAGGAVRYASAQSFFASFWGHVLLLAWSYALFYHLCNGIRHLFWDFGSGFELEAVYKSGWVVVGASVVLTAISWFLA